MEPVPADKGEGLNRTAPQKAGLVECWSGTAGPAVRTLPRRFGGPKKAEAPLERGFWAFLVVAERRTYAGTTFLACGPFGPCSTSKLTV